MASYRAIAGVCNAVIELLRSSYDDDFNNELEFKVYLARDFADPSYTTGVSLFLYRVFPNSNPRSPAGRLSPEGQRYKTQLPLDLHFVLTAWASDASLQHTLIGWMMRVLEDNPVLPSALLSAVAPNVFRPDETIEISLGELSNDDMLTVWENLVPNAYQLSIPYVARGVRIESRQVISGGRAVQERGFEYQKT